MLLANPPTDCALTENIEQSVRPCVVDLTAFRNRMLVGILTNSAYKYLDIKLLDVVSWQILSVCHLVLVAYSAVDSTEHFSLISAAAAAAYRLNEQATLKDS